MTSGWMGDRSRSGRLRRLTRRFPIVRGLLTLAAAVVALGGSPARAHNLGESYLYLQIYESDVTGRFEIALSDLNPALGLAGTELEITADNLDERIAFLQSYYRDHVTISNDGRDLPIVFGDHELLGAHEGFVLMPFELEGLQGVPESLTFDYSVLLEENPGHRGFLIVEHNWSTGTFANENQISLVFGPSTQRQEFDLTSSGRLSGFFAVVRLGIEHIWMGVDHVMFLVAILLPAVLRRKDGPWQAVDSFGPTLWYVVKVVTAFTIAHSVTLTLAALDLVRLPSRLVETAIAVSIAIAAAELLVPIFKGRVGWVVFGFGLFHGFGFAGALSEMGVLAEHAGLSLFAFNLGVEIGQVVIVALLFPFLYAVRRFPAYRRAVLPAAAVFMIVVAGVWTVERALDVDVPMRELLPTQVQKVIP